MAESNGRWKISPITAITVAINLVGWGITIGTLFARLDALEKKVDGLMPRAEVSVLLDSAQREHALMWQAIGTAKASERKK